MDRSDLVTRPAREAQAGAAAGDTANIGLQGVFKRVDNSTWLQSFLISPRCSNLYVHWFIYSSFFSFSLFLSFTLFLPKSFISFLFRVPAVKLSFVSRSFIIVPRAYVKLWSFRLFGPNRTCHVSWNTRTKSIRNYLQSSSERIAYFAPVQLFAFRATIFVRLAIHYGCTGWSISTTKSVWCRVLKACAAAYRLYTRLCYFSSCNALIPHGSINAYVKHDWLSRLHATVYVDRLWLKLD